MGDTPRDQFVKALEQAHATVMASMYRQNHVETMQNNEDQQDVVQPPEWAKEFRVKGVVYSVTVDKAKEMEWKLAASMAGAGNDRFVYVMPAIDDVYKYLQLANLSNDFAAIPIENYSQQAMVRVLAFAAKGDVKFGED